jgi:hypothetical protein
MELILAEQERRTEKMVWEEVCKMLDFMPDFQSITRKAHKKLSALEGK